jgi:hypothetical protein
MVGSQVPSRGAILARNGPRPKSSEPAISKSKRGKLNAKKEKSR